MCATAADLIEQLLPQVDLVELTLQRVEGEQPQFDLTEADLEAAPLTRPRFAGS